MPKLFNLRVKHMVSKRSRDHNQFFGADFLPCSTPFASQVSWEDIGVDYASSTSFSSAPDANFPRGREERLEDAHLQLSPVGVLFPEAALPYSRTRSCLEGFEYLRNAIYHMDITKTHARTHTHTKLHAYTQSLHMLKIHAQRKWQKNHERNVQVYFCFLQMFLS